MYVSAIPYLTDRCHMGPPAGGNRGIGLSIAKTYAGEGANFVVFGRNAETLAATEPQLGPIWLAVKGDVTGQTDRDRLFASDLNFKAVFFTVQAGLAYLNDGASVIITGNTPASSPVVGPSVSIAAKAGAAALGRTFAVELAPRGIRVNVSSPGPTATAARAERAEQ